MRVRPFNTRMATWLPQLPRDLKLHVGRIVGEEPEGSRRFPAPQEVLENPTSPPSHTSTKQGNFALITTFNIHDRREALSQVIRSVQLCLQVAWRGRLHRCRMWRGCPSPTGPGNVADKNSQECLAPSQLPCVRAGASLLPVSGYPGLRLRAGSEAAITGPRQK